MRMTQNKTPLESHDWKVKTLESPSAGMAVPSLRLPARACEPGDSAIPPRTTAPGLQTGEDGGTALADEITTRWLAQSLSTPTRRARLQRPAQGQKYLSKPEDPK